MSKKNNIPDPDFQLASLYKDMLDRKKNEADVKSPLLDLLYKARDVNETFESEIAVSGQDKSWNRIRDTISINDQKPSAKIFKLFSLNRWQWAAAAIALIVFSSLLYLQYFGITEPQLIAESGTQVSTVELADGSNVTLRPNSSLHQLALSENERSYSLSGEALFDVVNMSDKPFSVEAGPGRVVVTGTRFNLNDRGDKSSVYLLEGDITFETKDRKQFIRLSPGEAAVIDEESRLLDPFNFESDEITGWTQNRLTFRNRTAASVFTELEFHFNITIQAPSNIEQEILGGSIHLESLEQSLEDLGIVLGGSFVQTEESMYQFRTDQ